MVSEVLLAALRWAGQAVLAWITKCPAIPTCPTCPTLPACPACPACPSIVLEGRSGSASPAPVPPPATPPPAES
eukprot:1455061-Alexandrium_andersonii.AAC.1